MQPNSANNITFAERYDIRYELGAGAVGVVYKARDKILDKDVAIKLLKGKGSHRDIIRFQHEARACGRLVHRNILTALDFGTNEEGDPYLVLDYIEGKTVQAVLNEQGRLPLRDAVLLMLEIVSAMTYAHKAGVLHRDLKPSNLMIESNDCETEYGTLKIMDFGLAKLNEMEERGEDGLSMTARGSSIGSPAYMSPEQARGAEVDERTDIYSFGCIAFELLTGRMPFTDDTVFGIMHKKQTETPPSLNAACPDDNFPEGLEQIIAKCLATNEENRYARFEDLRDDLFKFVDSGAIELDQETVASIKQEIVSAKKNKLVSGTVLAIVGFIIVSAVAAGAFVTSRTEETKKPTHKWHRPIQPHGFIENEEVTLPTMSFDNRTLRFHSADAKKIKASVKPEFNKLISLRIAESDLRNHALLPLANMAFSAVTLDRCTIDDTTLQDLSKLTQLSHLWLIHSDSNLSDNGFADLSKSPKLDALDLVAESLSLSALKSLSTNKTLRHLKLVSRDFTEQSIAHLHNIPNLTSLEFGEQLDDACIQEIARTRTLSSLGLSDLAPGQLQRNMRALSKMPALTTLKISRSKIESNDFKELSALKHLDHVYIDEIVLPNNKPLLDIARADQIKRIDAKHMGSLTPEQLKILATGKNLHTLVLIGTFKADLEPTIAQIRAARPDLAIQIYQKL